MSANDLELLQKFTRDQSQDAFTALVHRHLDLVYCAALRQVRSRELAEEVAQSVFDDLARNATRLKPDTNLTAWLYEITRRTAINVVRGEARRQLREQIACEMNAMNATAADWTQVEPLLDEAMHALDETDRTAVLLRYFENKSLREVGQTLGTSDDTAQKRVSRAVERLREFFAKRGVAVGASGLAVFLSANAVQAAPVGLAATISTAASLAETVLATSVVTTATQAITMTSLQKTLIAVTLVAAAGTGIYEARQASSLRSQNQSLTEQHASLTEQFRHLSQSLIKASNHLATLRQDNEGLKSGDTLAELLRLRGQVAQLRSANAASGAAGNDPTQAAVRSWLDRVNRLKERLEQTPGAKIPELGFLNDENWLNAARGDLESDKDYRSAFARLRSAGENQFIISMQSALQKYMTESGGQFPSELSQLKPHFESVPDDALLQRYAIVPASNIPNLKMGGDWLITVKTPVDEEFDSLWALGPNGFGTSSYQPSNDAAAALATLAPALRAYESANNGLQPQNPSDLLPYVTTSEQQAAVQKLEQKRK